MKKGKGNWGYGTEQHKKEEEEGEKDWEQRIKNELKRKKMTIKEGHHPSPLPSPPPLAEGKTEESRGPLG